MKPGERFALALLSLAAACTGAAIVFALDHHRSRSSGISDGHGLRLGTTSDEQRTPLRAEDGAYHFAYVPETAVPLITPASTQISEAEDPGSWSAQMHMEAAPPIEGRPVNSGQQLMRSWQTRTIGNRVLSYGAIPQLMSIAPAANNRLAEKFEIAKAVWPPAEIALIAIKDEKVLELFSRSGGRAWTFIHRYRILAASGGAGPKLRQGDRQVPEGVYGISFLNPNSRYHLSLRVNYPNTFDRLMAAKDGRTDLGGDIMIHGKNASAGCLAIGDEAAEEVFVLAAKIGLPNIKLIIAPTDFRRTGLPPVDQNQPAWLPKLYTEVASAMAEFKVPQRPSLLSYFWNKSGAAN